MNVKLLTEHHLEFVSLKGGYTGSYESTLVKMPHFISQAILVSGYLRSISCKGILLLPSYSVYTEHMLVNTLHNDI